MSFEHPPQTPHEHQVAHEHADLHGPTWLDIWGPGLVIGVGLAYILLCALWRPVSGS